MTTTNCQQMDINIENTNDYTPNSPLPSSSSSISTIQIKHNNGM